MLSIKTCIRHHAGHGKVRSFAYKAAGPITQRLKARKQVSK